jgi:DNA repair protein RadC
MPTAAITVARPSKYLRRENTIFLDAQERRYHLAVRDLPDEEKPREKMLEQGPSSLGMAELLAVILNTGTKKEELSVMTNRIMKEYGELNILEQKSADKLAADLDIPLGKALQIVAIGELGRRAFAKNENSAPTIRTAREVFDYVVDMRSHSKEHLRGIYLNAHYKVIHDEIISIGTVDMSIIHPREVFRPALEYSAAAVILVHNHPSGDTTPNQADIEATKQIVAAGRILGIDLIDHVIVAKDSFLSIPVDYS